MPNSSSTLIDRSFQPLIVARCRPRISSSNSIRHHTLNPRSAPKKYPPMASPEASDHKVTRAAACNFGTKGQRGDPPETLTLLPPTDAKRTRRRGTQDPSGSVGTTPCACAMRGIARSTRKRGASLLSQARVERSIFLAAQLVPHTSAVADRSGSATSRMQLRGPGGIHLACRGAAPALQGERNWTEMVIATVSMSHPSTNNPVSQGEIL